MTRVFADLLSDAARNARPRAVLKVRSWAEDGFVCVSIFDAGRVIPKDRLDRVFDPYPGSGEDGNAGGPGLGAASEIVRNHRGEIRVRSGDGIGTTFTVHVPVVKEG
jgi:signal transduction histidine kinase